MGSGERILIKEVVGGLVEVLDGTGYAVLEETEIESDVEHLLLLPSQVGVGEALVAETRVVAVLIVAGGNPEAKGLVASKAGIIAGGSVADAQFEVAESVRALQEVLLLDAP